MVVRTFATRDEPLVVAIVSDAIAPYNKGGKEARHYALAQRMAGNGVDAHVYSMHWWPGPRDIAQGAVTLHAISPLVPLYSGARRSIREALVFSIACLRMLTRRFDVLEGDAIPFLQLFPLRLVATVRRKPLVVTWHEVWGRDYWKQYLGRLGVVAAWCEQVAVAIPDRIIAASEGTADRLREISKGKAHITVVPNGIDMAEIDAAPVATTAPDILCVGRLLAHKNVAAVVDAVAALRSRGRRVTLTVVGEGPEEAALAEQVARLQLTDQVTLAGVLESRIEVLGLMKGASVLAFPSDREGFGMVALEALACGTPVVTSDHADNFARSLVIEGVNGFVVPATAEALADALARSLESVEALSLAASEVAAQYDWDALAGQVAKVYRS
jgi:glycosyltransferase involved in cell wall biosynthesis